jgi:homoserine O-acetyltransferase
LRANSGEDFFLKKEAKAFACLGAWALGAWALGAWALGAWALSTVGAVAGEPLQHEFTLPHFMGEHGLSLPQARVVYGTYGTLNAAHDNAVLLPSHFMADMHGYQWLIGPGKALDPTKLFLVTSEMFGNGRSSSPSNTPAPFHGPHFPVMTIRDNVNAVHALLTEQLHISHLKAVIGFSMGAQQALQWAVSYPDYMNFVVATSGTAKTYGHGIVRLDGQIAALTADAAFKGGDYTAEPVVGIRATSLVWLGWLYSQEWWRRDLWKTDLPAGTTLQQAIDKMTKEFFEGADANDLILQMHTWESNDVGGTPPFHGDTEAALRSIRVPVLYMPSATDLYFPVEDARYEAGFIPKVTFRPIPSLWGHPAGAGASPADAVFLNTQIGAFLAAHGGP